MKPHLPVSLFKALTLALASTVYFSTADAACLHAAVSPTTYTDFGQNMARYSVYQVNDLLSQIRKRDGVQISYTTGTPPANMGEGQPMISFEGVNGDGAFTAVGYNYTATVAHNGCPNPCFTARYVGDDQAIHYQGVEYRSSQNKVFLLSPSIDYKITRSSKIYTDITASGVFDTTQYLRDGGVVTDLVHYRAGAGTCDQADFEGNTHNLAGGYSYITGGVVATLGFSYMAKSDTYVGYDYRVDYKDGEGPRDVRGIIDDPYTISIRGIQDYGPGGAGQPTPDNPKVYLLPFVSRGGDSGSPVWAWNEKTKAYELISCHQARGGDNSYSRGASEWTMATMEYFNKHVDMDNAGHTVILHAVTISGEHKADNNAETTLQYGTITSEQAGFAEQRFCGVGQKNGETVYTWLSLAAEKNQQNWYRYGDAYFNANGSGKDKAMTLGDLFYTENLVFESNGSDVNHIKLDADIDTGIGYAQFSRKKDATEGQNVKFYLESNGKADGGRDFMLNTSGFITDAGTELHIGITNTQRDASGDFYYREWRKQGDGNMYLEGSGNNEIFLNLGGKGTTYLREQNGGYAAYNVLINNGATLNFNGDINQIARDVTFGNGGGYLEFSGLASFDWYSGENANVSGAGFTINALTQDATLINSTGSTTLHYLNTENTTFLGSFQDTKDSSLTVIYEGGGTWTLNSIHTNLQNKDSRFIAASGTTELVGQLTKHGIGSIEGKGGTRYSHPDDWHYSDATMNVEVRDGATFRLGSHARLKGNVDVQSGGTLEIAEGVKHQYEYIEGWLIAEDTTSEFYRDFYGLKGNVDLEAGATLRFNFAEGTDAENVYGGDIKGSGNVEMQLGGSGATLVLSGQNDFTGTKDLSGGGLVAQRHNSLGNTTENKWLVNRDAFIAVKGLDGNEALEHIDASSTGVIALTQSQTEQVDLTKHTHMIVGALAGDEPVQYGTAPVENGHKITYTTDKLTPVELDGQRKWQLGGGGGELVVNFLLEDSSAELVLGNEYTTGTVTLTNIWNQIGSINFAGQVTLNYTSEEALGGSKISLGYSNRVIGSSSLLKNITRTSDGVLLLDKMPTAAVDLTDHHFMALGSDGDMVYSGSITPTSGIYRFGGITGTLELQTALTDGENETRSLMVDGQGYAGGTLALATKATLTGDVVVTGHDADRHPEFSGGDIALRLDTEDAIASASHITVKEGGNIDINGTTQTFHGFNMEAGSALVDTSDFWTGRAVVEVAEGTTSRLGGNVDVYSLTKKGQGDMVLGGSNNYGVFFINQGRVLLENGNALSATGTAMLEENGVLDVSNVDISAAIGFAGGTLQVGTKRVAGSLAVATGYNGTVQQNAANITTSINSGLQVAEGATLRLSGEHGNFNFSAEEINENGGTIALEGNRIAFTNGKEMTIGGIVSLKAQGLSESERVTLYSDGSSDNMIRNINELRIEEGQHAAIQEASWNTIWNIHSLTGSGDLKWVSNTTHWYSARVVLDGANSFDGLFTAERTYGNVSNRSYQSFVEAKHDLAMQNMDVSVIGKGAQSHMALAVNTDDLHMRSLSGNEHALLYAGASVEGADHDTDTPLVPEPNSTRRATLTITGTGDHTFSGNVTGQNHYEAYETKENGTKVQIADVTNAGISIVMDGTGKQTFNGAHTRFNSVTVNSGKLALTSAGLTIMEDVSIKRGAELQLSNAYALGSGKTLTVLANDADTSSTAKLSGLALNGGTISFSAEGLSADTPALTLGALSGNSVTINFTETYAFTSGVDYYLANQDWSNVNITEGTQDLSYLTASYRKDASGLYVRFATKDGNLIWGGTNESHEWNGSFFGPSDTVPTAEQTAVFNDAAANHHVNITGNVDVAGMVFDAAGDYDLTSNNASKVTTGSVVQSGTGTTILSDAVQVGTSDAHGNVTISDGELRIKSASVLQYVDTITGGGTLGVDFGAGNSGTVDSLFAADSSVSFLHVVSGTFEANAAPDPFMGLLLDNGAGYKVGVDQSLVYVQAGQGEDGSPATLDLANHKLTSAMVVMQGDLVINGTGGELNGDISGGHTITTNGTVTLRGTNYDGTLHVQSGRLNVYNGANSYLTGITMEDDTILYLGISTGLEGGATIHMGNNASLQMENGAGGSHIVNANIVMDGSNASISGTLNGNNTVVQGSVTGHGTLSLKTQSTYWNNSWRLDSLLQDSQDGALALSSSAKVTLTAANTYSGGTTITSNTLTTDNERALGTGALEMTGGNLVLNKDLTIGGLSGTAGNINLGENTLTVDTATSTQFSGDISNGSIVKLGSGSLAIEVGGYFNDISVKEGSLSLGYSSISGHVSVEADTTLNFTGEMLGLSNAVANAGTFNFTNPETTIEIESGNGFDIHTDGYLDVDGQKADNGFAQGLTIQVFENTGNGKITGESAPEVHYMSDTLMLDLTTGVASKGGSNTTYTVRSGTVTYDDTFAGKTGAKAIENFALASADAESPATLRLSRNLDDGVEIIVSGYGGNIHLDKDVELSAAAVTMASFAFTPLSGEGTLVLTPGTVVMPGLMSIAEDGDWTGTVRISNTSFKDADITGLANSTSRVEMYGITGGYLKQWQSSLDTNIRLTDTESGAYAWKWTDGQSTGASTITFTGTWDGSGSFVVGGKNQNFTFKGDISDWNGRYIQNGNSSTVTFSHTGEKQVVNADFGRKGGNLNMVVGDGSNATYAEFQGSLRNVSSLEVKARSTAELAGTGNSIGTLTVNESAQLVNSGTTTLTGVLTNSGTITNSATGKLDLGTQAASVGTIDNAGTLTIGTKLTNGTIANTGTLIISSLMEGAVSGYVDALEQTSQNGNGFATTTLTVREEGATITNSGDGVILYGGVNVTDEVVNSGKITEKVNYGSYRIAYTDNEATYSAIASMAQGALEHITMESGTHLKVNNGESSNLHTSQIVVAPSVAEQPTLDLLAGTTLVVDASTTAKLTAETGSTITLQMQMDDPAAGATIGGLTGGTVNVAGSGVLDLGGQQRSIGMLNISAATVLSSFAGSGGGFTARGDVEIAQGGKLQLSGKDALGWNGSCTKSITILGDVDTASALELGARQTLSGSTAINMQGNAVIRAMAGYTTSGDDRPMLDAYTNNPQITASGKENLVAVPLRMRTNFTFNVLENSELTFAGGTAPGYKNNAVNKNGQGKLIFDALQVNYGTHEYNGTLAINEGSVEVNTNASFNNVTSEASLTITNGTSTIGTYAGSNGATLSVQDGAKLVINGNSTIASAISNSGSVSFGSECTTLTLTGEFESGLNIYRDIALGTVSTSGNGLKSSGYVTVLTDGGNVEMDGVVTVGYNEQTYTLHADGKAYQAASDNIYYARQDTAVYNSAVAAETTITQVSLSDGVILDLQAELAEHVTIKAEGGIVNIGEGIILARESLSNISSESKNTSLTGTGTYLMDVSKGTTLGNRVVLGEDWQGALRLAGEASEMLNLNTVAQKGAVYAALEVAGVKAPLQEGDIHPNLVLTDLDGGTAALTVTNTGNFTFKGDISGAGHIVNEGNGSTFTFNGTDLSQWNGGIENNGVLNVGISGMENGASLNASLVQIDNLTYTAKKTGNTYTVASLETKVSGTTVTATNGTLNVANLSGRGNLTVNGNVGLAATDYAGQNITVARDANLQLNELQARQAVLNISGTVALGGELVEVNALEGSGGIEAVGEGVHTLSLSTVGEHTASATIGANIDLEMNGSGKQTLTGDLSAFNGDIYMMGGTLSLQQSNASTSIGVLNMSGGSVEFARAGASLGAARVTTGAEAAITVADGTAVQLGRAIQNSGTLTLTGCFDASALTSEQMDIGFIDTAGVTTNSGSGFIARSNAVRVVRNISSGSLNAGSATVLYDGENAKLDENGLAILNRGRNVLADTYYVRDTQAGKAVYSVIANKAKQHGGTLEHLVFDEVGDTYLTLDAEADSSMFSADILTVANVELTQGGKLTMEENAVGVDGKMRLSGNGEVVLSNRSNLARNTSLTQEWVGTVVLTGNSNALNLSEESGLWNATSTVKFDAWHGTLAEGSNAVDANVVINDMALDASESGAELAFNNAVSGAGDLVNNSGAELSIDFNGDISSWNGKIVTESGSTIVNLNESDVQVNAAIQKGEDAAVAVHVMHGATFNQLVEADALAIEEGATVQIAGDFNVDEIMTYGSISVDKDASLSVSGHIIDLNTPIVNNGSITFNGEEIQNIYLDDAADFKFSATSYADEKGLKTSDGNGFLTGGTATLISMGENASLTGAEHVIVSYRSNLYTMLDDGTFGDRYGTHTYYIHKGTVNYSDIKDAPGLQGLHLDNTLVQGGNATLNLDDNLAPGLTSGIVSTGGILNLAQDVTLQAFQLQADTRTILTGSGLYDLGNSVALGVTLDSSWTGTVRMANVEGLSGFNLSNYAKNADATVAVCGLVGSLDQNTSLQGRLMLERDTSAAGKAALNITAASAKTYTFAGGVTGQGDMLASYTGSNATFQFNGDLSTWSGAFISSGNDTNTTSINLKDTSATIGAPIRNTSANAAHKVNVTVDNTLQAVYLNGALAGINTLTYNSHANGRALHIADLTTHASGTTLNFTNGQFAALVEVDSLHGSGKLTLDNTCKSDGLAHFAINGGDYAGATIEFNAMREGYSGGDRRVLLTIGDENVAKNSVIHTTINKTGGKPVNIGIGVAANTVRVGGLDDNIVKAEGTCVYTLVSGNPTNHTGADSTGFTSDGTVRTLEIVGAGGTSQAKVGANLNITMNSAEGEQVFSGDMSSFSGAIDVKAGTLNLAAPSINLHEVSVAESAELIIGVYEGATSYYLHETITNEGDLTLCGNFVLDAMDISGASQFEDGQASDNNGFLVGGPSIQVVRGNGETTLVFDSVTMTYKSEEGQFDAETGIFSLSGHEGTHYETFYVNASGTAESLAHAKDASGGNLSTVRLTNGTTLNMDLAGGTLNTVEVSSAASATLHVTKNATLSTVKGLEHGQTLAVTGADGGRLTMAVGADTAVGGAIEVRDGGYVVLGNSQAFGSHSNKVVIGQGGTVDINGKSDAKYVYTLDGGFLTNTGGALQDNWAQTSGLVLTDDSSIGGNNGDFRILSGSFAANSVKLDGHILTKVGSNTLGFVNTSFNEGTLRVEKGKLDFDSGKKKNNDVLNGTRIVLADAEAGTADKMNGLVNVEGRAEITAEESAQTSVQINIRDNAALSVSANQDKNLKLTGAVSGNASTTILKNGTGSVEVTGSMADFSGSIDAQGGVLDMLKQGSLSVKDVTIANGATVGAYTTAEADEMHETTLTISGTLAAKDANSKLNANVVMLGNSTLDVSATGGKGISLGSTLTINDTINLSEADFAAVAGLGYGERYVLFNGVDSLTLDQTDFEAITPEMQLDAADWFKGLDPEQYYVVYDGSNVGQVAIFSAVAPEPTTSTLSLLALAALAARRRRKS